MTAVDIATTLVPGLLLLLAVGLGGDAISRTVANVASSRHNLTGLVKEQEGLREVYKDRRERTDTLAKELSGVEHEYLNVHREFEGLRKAEKALMDPEKYTVFEIGRPAPGCEGWYVKVLLRRKHIMFGGLGTTPTNSEAYRLARVAMWNVNQDTARQFCVQRFSKEASVLSIQAFRGKIMIADV
ncbi:hypothetical protein [Ferrovibrio xuzhouensis]|uniref:Uncharacterized protein n=1 Tax=Ferrovibrio xuzhouensis TaxID=1576914 RepID=A0ABV7VLB7_9PROT